MKCVLCGKEITERESNNAEPLAEGRCCNDCNWKVIKERLKRVNTKPAEESMAVIGTGGPVDVTDPMADFEKYAKEFEKTFILGETPKHKEEPKNKTKVKDGEVVGEVDSMDKDEKVDQVDPLDENKNTKSATEGVVDSSLISAIKKTIEFCQNSGIDTLSELEEFIANQPEPGSNSIGSNSLVSKLKDLMGD